jgi:transposase
MAKPLVLEASTEERRELEKLAKSRDRHEADRARAILLSLDGVGRKQIAESLLVSVDQVSRWRGQYHRGRVDAIRARPHPGRPPELADAALPVVEEILAEPAPVGMVWTVARLAQEVHRRCGVEISESWLSVVMRKKGVSAGVARGTRSRAGRMWIKSSDPG